MVGIQIDYKTTLGIPTDKERICSNHLYITKEKTKLKNDINVTHATKEQIKIHDIIKYLIN